MMKKSLLAGALLLCPAAFATTTHWEYSGEAGPARWASLTPNMASVPVATSRRSTSRVWCEGRFGPLQFHYQAGGKTLVNNGHTVQVNYAPAAPFELDGMHFNSSSSTSTPPAKTSSKAGPTLEGHLVHANDKGELAVVAVMFEPGQPMGP